MMEADILLKMLAVALVAIGLAGLFLPIIPGAVLGAAIGIFFGLPGVLLGPFLGAAIGEFSTQRHLGKAGRAGFGATVGIVLGTAAKLAIAFTMLGIFAIARFAGGN